MAINQRTASPYWVSLTFLAGLVLVFLGRRELLGGPSSAVTWAGLALVLATIGLRVVTTARATGGRRRVERTLLLCQLGAGLGLVAYGLSTPSGAAMLGISPAGVGATHFHVVMQSVAAILIAVSAIPLVIVEATLGTSRREGFDLAPRTGEALEDNVEYFRVRELSVSGLSIALAMGFLMVTCSVGKTKNVRRDVSYFKTSSPGESTKNIIRSIDEAVEVLLFFPDQNEVEGEIHAYFEELARSGKLSVNSYNRAVMAQLAKDNSVTTDGTVVLRRGDKNEKFIVDTSIEKARRGKGKLRTLDREVNQALLKLVRTKRRAYLTVGHGELTDAASIPSSKLGKIPERKSTSFASRMLQLNYETKPLGMIDLVRGVPDDASMVMMLGPITQPSEPELAALDEYLTRGGRLLIALDPAGDATLGELLASRLGVTFDAGRLTDDKAFFPAHRNLGDRRWVLTQQFSAHASTTTLSRTANRSGLLLLDSGSLLEHPFADNAKSTKRTFVIRSMPTAWIDRNNNLTFDDADVLTGEPGEQRARYNIAAAVEGPMQPATGGAAPDSSSGFRAMVLADVDLFADLTIVQSGIPSVEMVSGPLLDDAVKWLGGEEVFAGEVVSEEDAPLRHSQDEDSAWFLGTLLGAPGLVLGVGLLVTRRRKRASKSERSAAVGPEPYTPQPPAAPGTSRAITVSRTSSASRVVSSAPSRRELAEAGNEIDNETVPFMRPDIDDPPDVDVVDDESVAAEFDNSDDAAADEKEPS